MRRDAPLLVRIRIMHAFTGVTEPILQATVSQAVRLLEPAAMQGDSTEQCMQ
jgi:hypothetical protein